MPNADARAEGSYPALISGSLALLALPFRGQVSVLVKTILVIWLIHIVYTMCAQG